MKTSLFQVFLLLISFCASSQNVGINNPNPKFPLTFNSALGDKISFWTDGTPTHYGIGVQSGLLQIYSKTDFDNIGFGYGSSSSFAERVRIVNKGETGIIVNGRLVLANGTIPLNTDYGAGIWLYKPDNSSPLGFIGVQNNQNLGFYGGPLGWGLVYDAVNSRVGIGTSTPNAPLGFLPALGKKITLYPGATGDVGMAVQGNLLQIYSDNPNADIAFGYDQAGLMTERMRIKGNGNVGIGMTNPLYPLDVNGRIRLSGTNLSDPGIWLNDAGAERAFMGLENNDYVGFYGNQGAGWKFAMNNSSGALKVNGSEGQAGQVLKSSGSGAAPNWSSVSAWLFNNIYQINQLSTITLPVVGGQVFPGMDYGSFSVVVPTTSKLIIALDVKIESIGCFSCGTSYVFCQTNINRDGSSYDLLSSNGSIVNNTIGALNTGIKVFTVPPGTYTFYSYAYNLGGPGIRASEAKLLIVVIPQ